MIHTLKTQDHINNKQFTLSTTLSTPIPPPAGTGYLTLNDIAGAYAKANNGEVVRALGSLSANHVNDTLGGGGGGVEGQRGQGALGQHLRKHFVNRHDNPKRGLRGLISE